MLNGTFLNSVGIVIQYIFLAAIYYFLYNVLKVIQQDIKKKSRALQTPIILENTDTVKALAVLIVIDKGKFQLADKYIIKDSFTIGRGGGNSLVINDSYISNEHACITLYKDGYWLTDLNSTNGTVLNGYIVTAKTKLRPEDIIKTGEVLLKFKG